MLIYVYYGHIHILMYIGVYVRVCSVSKSCLTLCDSMHCSLPGSSVHGISQARILEWVAVAPPGDLPSGQNPRPLCFLHQQADSLPRSHLGSPCVYTHICT